PELQRACELDPALADAWRTLGIANRELQRYPEAVAALEHAVRLATRDAEAHYLLGQSLQSLGRTDEAKRAWNAALEIDPNHMQALSSLLRATAKTEPEESRTYQARLERLQQESTATDRARTLSNFAIASAKVGKWDEAVSQLREAIQACGNCSSQA